MGSILNSYKRLIQISLLFEAVQRNPDKYYNYAYNILKILGVVEIRQTEINYNKVMEIVFNAIEFLENNYILENEKIKVIC